MYFSTVFLLLYFASNWCESSSKYIVKRKSIGYGTDASPPIRRPASDTGKHANVDGSGTASAASPREQLIKLLQSRAPQGSVLANDLVPNSDPKPPIQSPDYGASVERIRSTIEALQAQLSGMRLAPQTTDGTTRSTPPKPTSGPYMGFSPTEPTSTVPPVSPTTAKGSGIPNSDSSHVVGARQVPQHKKLLPILKQTIAESFINAFDIIKKALLKIDKDVDEGFRQLYNLETDHYNAANGDINANGDKIDRLKTFIANELNTIKNSKPSSTVDQSTLNRNMQTTLDTILNITNTILNVTRTVNDRTERITEIKEKELQLAMMKEGHHGHHKHGVGLKHHGHAAHHKHPKEKLVPHHAPLPGTPKSVDPPSTVANAESPPLGANNELAIDAPSLANRNIDTSNIKPATIDTVKHASSTAKREMDRAKTGKSNTKPATTKYGSSTAKREMDRLRLGHAPISKNNDDFGTDIIKLLEDYVDEE